MSYKPSTINHKLILVGTNHKYSQIELRERLSFSKKRLKEAIVFLKERSFLKGAIILSTCNRIEIYASADNQGTGIEEVRDFIARYYEIDKKSFSPYFYTFTDEEAFRHLLSVASGLDSLILGETQILDQVKFAYDEAEKVGFVDGFLQSLFVDVVSTARRAHREANISEEKVSVGSVAIDFIKEKLGSLSGKNILIIGAGKVTELVLKYLKDEKSKVVFISNRTFDKARELAFRIGQSAVRFDKLPQLVKRADVIISATTSPHFIIKKETLSGAISRKLLIVDLAMPRDVDPKVLEIENVELFNLEDLSSIVQKNLEKKRLEAKRIEELINQDVDLLWQKLTALEPEPVLLP
ncbi:MAG: glutamyl-tRNA reductase [Candidatus Omnitrophica bacterium]|nr:glutamyl-tRNA reductase [Candidatus Omnitrophota bacterium]MBU1809898.1 glutamyl-tRNA reductase [Candidatus Omnitrophota bacterium]